MSRADRPRVVLVGGGYVTVWAVRALRRWARDRVDVVVVSPDPSHVFHGWTGEIVAGDLPVEAGLTALSEAIPTARVVSGRVVAVDRVNRTVRVAGTQGASLTLTYDHLVVGCGTSDRTDSVAGLAEHALVVRAAPDVAALLARLDILTARGESRRRLPQGAPPGIVVVGGGLAGVELAAALARRVGPGAVTLVQRSSDLGADLAADHPGLGRRMGQRLAVAGVAVRTGSPLVAVEPDRVVLGDGSVLAADLVVAACGTRARPLPGLDDLPADPAGRLVTDDRLHVAPGVWAGGDAAAVPFVAGGSCPASALWAITHGTRIGRSIARSLHGLPAGRYRFRGIGRAACLGPGQGVVELRGLPMTGWLAWAVRLAFFLRYAPSGRQGVRVAGWWLASLTGRAGWRTHGRLPAVHAAGPTPGEAQPRGPRVPADLSA